MNTLPWILLALSVALLVLALVGWWTASTRVRRHNVARNVVARAGESAADLVLREAGFEVLDRQVTGRWDLRVDGEEARCTLLYDHADRRVQLYFARKRSKVELLAAYARGTQCRWKMILDYFDEEVQADDECGHCDNCVQRKADIDASTLKMKAQPRLKKGDAVRVAKFGRGTVAEARDDRIAVTFSGGETREFEPRYVMPARERAA